MKKASVTGTLVTDTAPTCSATGTGHYAATFSDPFTNQNSSNIDISTDPNAHTWQDAHDTTNHWKECKDCQTKDQSSIAAHTYSSNKPSYIWNGTTCNASLKCDGCDYAQTAQATGVENITQAPTCSATGLATYTATFSSPFTTQTKENVEVAINPDAHKWDDGKTTKEPTCTEKGVYTYTCEYNSEHTKTADIAIDKDAHSWDDGKVTKAATCAAKGVLTYTCKHNSEHTKTEEIAVDKDAHTWDDGKVTKEATCTAKGEKTYTCKNDSTHTKTEEIAIDKDAHTWDDGKVTKAATCAAKGEKTYTCKNDPSHTKTEDIAIDKDAHTWGDGKITTEATCAAKGVLTYTCKNNSSHTKTEEIAIDKDAHSWDDSKVTKAATCTTKGVLTYTCKNDSSHTKEEEIAIDKDAHSWDEGKVTKAATCTTKGVLTYTCKIDPKHTKTEEIAIDKDAHTWDEGKITREATCTEAGEKVYTCKNDNTHTKTEVIPAGAGHKLTATAAKEATCTEDGNSAYWTCSVCKKHFSDANGKTEIKEGSWVIKAAGHKLTATAAKEATCTTDGNSAYWTCSVCKKHFSDANGKTEIKEGSWVIKAHHPADKIVTDAAVLPTCEKTGLTAGSHCEECGAVIVAQEVIEPLGHEFMGWHTDNAGNHTNRCITCRLEKSVACTMTALPGFEEITFCPICGYCGNEGVTLTPANVYLEEYDGTKTGVPRYYILEMDGAKYLILSFENNGRETRTEGKFTFTLPEDLVKGNSFVQISTDGTETPVEMTENYGYHRMTLDYTPEGKEPIQVMILKIVASESEAA